MRPESVPAHVRRRARARSKRLQSLGFANYSVYLGSPIWRLVKARYRASGQPQECMCGATDVELHHTTYERVGGDERSSDLCPLCPECHRLVHVLERRGDIELDLKGLYDAKRAERNAHETLRQIDGLVHEQYGEFLLRLARMEVDLEIALGYDLSRSNRDKIRCVRHHLLRARRSTMDRALVSRYKHLSHRLSLLEGEQSDDASPIKRELDAITRQLVRAEAKAGAAAVDEIERRQRVLGGIRPTPKPWNVRPARNRAA